MQRRGHKFEFFSAKTVTGKSFFEAFGGGGFPSEIRHYTVFFTAVRTMQIVCRGLEKKPVLLLVETVK